MIKNPDYATAKYRFVAVRKNIFRDSKYLVYLFEDELIITQEDYKVKYCLPLTLNLQIGWAIYNRGEEIILTAFKFQTKQGMKDMVADHDDLVNLKLLLSNKISFYKISDFYSPLYVIGVGSTAKVLMGQSHFDNDRVAIKCIQKQYLLKNVNGMQSFQTEVDILRTLTQYRTLKQKYFIDLQEVFEGDLTYYLIVDLMQGKSLQAEMEFKNKKNRQFTPCEVKLIMKLLLEGVKLMHKTKIIHRDLKPENIMFAKPNDYSSLRIVDFGLATYLDLDEYLFSKCGTPGFVAPEILNLQKNQTKYNELCDMFSIGCIFYQLVTGNNLFPGTDFNEVIKLNKICDIPFTNQDFENMSVQTYDLMFKLLHRNPSLRINARDALNHSYFTQVIPNENFIREQLAQSPPKQSQQSPKKLKLVFQDDDLEEQDPYYSSPFQKQAEMKKPVKSERNMDQFFLGKNGEKYYLMEKGDSILEVVSPQVSLSPQKQQDDGWDGFFKQANQLCKIKSVEKNPVQYLPACQSTSTNQEEYKSSQERLETFYMKESTSQINQTKQQTKGKKSEDMNEIRLFNKGPIS